MKNNFILLGAALALAVVLSAGGSAPDVEMASGEWTGNGIALPLPA